MNGREAGVGLLDTTSHFSNGPVAESGMREMLERRMDELMEYIDGLMMDTDINPFSYDPVDGSRVLSGEEEAVFDWISVNYLLGNFAGKLSRVTCFTVSRNSE